MSQEYYNRWHAYYILRFKLFHITIKTKPKTPRALWEKDSLKKSMLKWLLWKDALVCNGHICPCLSWLISVVPSLVQNDIWYMFYLCDLIKRPNTQAAIQGNLHTFRLRIQIVFSLPGRKEEHITKSEIYIFQKQTVCIQFCICICIYIFLHSVLRLKKCIKNPPTKKAVSVLWFLKETCISEANNFAQKNQCWQSNSFVATNVKRPFWGIIFLQKQGVKC